MLLHCECYIGRISHSNRYMDHETGDINNGEVARRSMHIDMHHNLVSGHMQIVEKTPFITPNHHPQTHTHNTPLFVSAGEFVDGQYVRRGQFDDRFKLSFPHTQSSCLCQLSF